MTYLVKRLYWPWLSSPVRLGKSNAITCGTSNSLLKNSPRFNECGWASMTTSIPWVPRSVPSIDLISYALSLSAAVKLPSQTKCMSKYTSLDNTRIRLSSITCSSDSRVSRSTLMLTSLWQWLLKWWNMSYLIWEFKYRAIGPTLLYSPVALCSTIGVHRRRVILLPDVFRI